MTSQLAELVLTCGSWQEAQNIADHLLENKLVTCVEFMDVKSSNRWDVAVDETNGVKLIVLSEDSKFRDIEIAVTKIRNKAPAGLLRK